MGDADGLQGRRRPAALRLPHRAHRAGDRARRRDLGPAALGWGSATLLGVTDNRSLEAHLADYGLDLPYGTGRRQPGPRRLPAHDRPERRRAARRPRRAAARAHPARRVARTSPTTGPSTRSSSASTTPTTTARRAGCSSARCAGPGACRASPGRRRRLRQRRRRRHDRRPARPRPGLRRARRRAPRRARCCARGAARGRAHDRARPPSTCAGRARASAGARSTAARSRERARRWACPFLTGSEENRGPLYDVTHDNHEGRRLPRRRRRRRAARSRRSAPPVADFPHAVPLIAVRLGDRMIVDDPRRDDRRDGPPDARRRARRGRARGRARASRIAGYANEFVHYFTTPEEYDLQHYEGGSTLYGKYSSNLIKDDLAALAGASRRRPRRAPVGFDPRNGVVPDTTPVRPRRRAGRRRRAAAATCSACSAPTFAWHGGQRGFDRPLDQRVRDRRARATRKRRWRAVTDDLGLEILWRVDDDGRYTAQWQVPLSARAAQLPLRRHRAPLPARLGAVPRRRRRPR